MKKIFTLLMIAMVGFALTGCRQRIWDELDELDNRVTALEEIAQKMNSDIAAIQTILNAIQNNVFVTDVIKTPEGYTIQFSDGTSAVISNGTDGSNAPVISIKQDTDGNYYWTINGEWLIVDGERVRANGHDGMDGQNGTNGQNGQDGADGQDGQDAVAPQVRINPDTKEWEISVDGGVTWESTGVVAEGQDGENGSIIVEGETLFQSIDYSNEDYVIFTLADGTVLKVARYDETAPSFVVIDAPEVVQMEYGTTMEFAVEAENVFEHLINVPEGWHASYINNVLSITAPAKDLCHFDKEGTVAITVVSESGKMAIVKVNVFAGEWVNEVELRILTFEDADCNGEEIGDGIYTWSEFIPTGGQYGNGHGSYWWGDYGNTEIEFTPVYGMYGAYGGHAGISNYVGSDWQNEGNFSFDLQAYNVTGGHSGTNFNTYFGYLDESGYGMMESLPPFYFWDGEARVIDHMWVTNTTYVYNQAHSAGFGSDYVISDESTFKIVAYGYESDDDTEPTVAEFYLLNVGQNFVTEWTKWDLSVLGKVTRVEFNCVGSDDMYGSYGMSVPGYFAYDDVAVQFPGETVFR